MDEYLLFFAGGMGPAYDVFDFGVEKARVFYWATLSIPHPFLLFLTDDTAHFGKYSAV